MNRNVQNSAAGKHAIFYSDADKRNRGVFWQFMGNILISGLLYSAIVFSLLSMFQLKQVSFLAILPGFLVIIFINYSFKRVNKGLIVFVFLTFFTIFFLVQHTNMIGGLLLIFNQMVETIGTNTDLILNKYVVTIDAEHHRLAASYFWSYISMIIAYICSIIILYRKIVWLWVVMLPLFIFQLYTGVTPGLVQHVLLFISILLVVNHSFISAANQGLVRGTSRHGVVISSSFILLVLVSATFVILNWIHPATSYSQNSAVVAIQDTLADIMVDIRYEKSKPNTFTQGDFMKLGDLELRDIPALEVVMDKPTSLYLRGYVGSLYTSERWMDLNHEDYYESNDLFYWLHQSQFNALRQLFTVNDVVNNVEDQEEVTLTVNNLNANSKYMYTPYELKSDLDQFEKVKTYNDSMLMSTAFFGERHYQYQLTPNLVTKYPALASRLYDLKETNEAEDYLTNESHYNEYVYQYYTAIPDTIHELMQNHLGSLPVNEKDHMPYEMAINKVKTYLNENMTYKVHVEPLLKGQDFLLHFLEDTKHGYATHYATAATVMFRYLGIPSRYVEGYLITPKDIHDVSEFEKITINGTNSHAWTEIYMDEIGWIPIEVTPPYYTTMEQTDLANYPKGDFDKGNAHEAIEETLGDASEGIQEVVDDEQMRNNTTDSKRNEDKSLLKYFMIAISIILLLILLTYISYIVKKRLDIRKRKKSFEDENYKQVIPALFTYSMMLLHYDGLPRRGGSTYSHVNYLEDKYSKEYARLFEGAIEINQESLFSTHEISEEKYKEMKQFMNTTLLNLLESKNIFQRIKMRIWDFIY